MNQSFTPEDLRSVFNYLEDGDMKAVNSGAAARLVALASITARKMGEDAKKYYTKSASMEKRLERKKANEEKLTQQGVFAESELDSVDVAASLLFCLQQRAEGSTRIRISRGMLQAILYEMYASWLASKRERLFSEHPVATSWGPHFWRVYKHLPDTGMPVSYDVYKRVAEQNPGVAAFCKNAANKYFDWKEKDLRDPQLKSEPFRAASAERNRGKWNTQLDDALIYAWKNRNV